MHARYGRQYLLFSTRPLFIIFRRDILSEALSTRDFNEPDVTADVSMISHIFKELPTIADGNARGIIADNNRQQIYSLVSVINNLVPVH